ncbi:hypothetical protein [Nitrosomonas sp.]|uniref:hypothetical protein n=1 Tax=Nitrosomonas sp. TaxID=42353 RepID=UPI00248DFBED|nr:MULTISPECIES: hypothetical protein [Nitrosomonas]MCW5600443.1 hypothetical protein [Nitrosomonas sp.]
MSDPYLYHIIQFIESDGNPFFHWELFKSVQDAEEAVFDIVARDNDHDIAHYNIKPIPVRS